MQLPNDNLNSDSSSMLREEGPCFQASLALDDVNGASFSLVSSSRYASDTIMKQGLKREQNLSSINLQEISENDGKAKGKDDINENEYHSDTSEKQRAFFFAPWREDVDDSKNSHATFSEEDINASDATMEFGERASNSQSKQAEIETNHIQLFP
ncbi:uncharacterized protein G2W53_018468 [Senna tora]|uniref:Uncharacterized protein n=1 Tax=Senna tora TaxID=362788 RepID=A0A834TT56_9FABA|nr:uncharacterized protein G2W53_018468 [Senna tora]